MGVKKMIQDFLKARESKSGYGALAIAIQTKDLRKVKELIANEPGIVGYTPPENLPNGEPLMLALHAGDAEVFKALLDTPEGVSASKERAGLHVTAHSYQNGTTYFEPSYLYAAIQNGKEDIAVLLAGKEWIDPEYAGHFVFSSRGGDRKLEDTPLALAEKSGMTRVVQTLRERLQPVLAERDKEAAEKARLRAAELRAQAEALEKQATQLAPAPSSPPANNNKLNI